MARAELASPNRSTPAVVAPRRRPNTTCDLCSTPIYRRPTTLAINAGKFCSRACRNRAHPRTGPRPEMVGRQAGAANAAWKGGVTYWRKAGNYPPIKYVRAPKWARPMARKDGYVMEHRLLMAQMIGRLLSRVECVHHRDHDPLNNALANLELWPTNADHKRGEIGRSVLGVANRVGSGPP